MKLDQRLVLGSSAAILLVAAVAGGVFALKQARATNDELSETRHVLAEQRRVSKRLEAELKLARTGAELQGLGQNLASEEDTSAALDAEAAPTEAADAPEPSERMKAAIEDADALVETATRAGKWTETDRDRLEELLVDVEGPERMRIQSRVGNLLVDGRLVTDADFVPL